jgi:hypothetical protein
MELLSDLDTEDENKSWLEETQNATRVDGGTGGGIYSATGGQKVKENCPVATGEGMEEYQKVPQWLYQLVWASIPQWRNCCRGYPL